MTLAPRSYLARLERHYRTSAPLAHGWIADHFDHLKGSLLTVVLGPAAAVGLYAAIRTWPSRWWLVVGLCAAALVVGIVEAGPLALPWVTRVTPLSRLELRQRLERLATRAGASALGVHQYRAGSGAGRANAALVGLGRAQRILLSDRLLEDYSDEEIEVVLAHELAHHLHADIWKGLASDTAVILLACYAAARALGDWGPTLGLRGPDDVAGLPLALLVGGAATAVAVPLVNLWSRHHERRADRFALELTQNPAAFISAMRRLGADHLAERPPRLAALLFYTHPPVHERIAVANALAREWGRHETTASSPW